MITTASIESARTTFRTAIQQGKDWLRSQQNQDGSMKGSNDGGVATFYKTPLALISRGEVEAAGRLLDWIGTKDQLETGDFGSNSGRGAMRFNAAYPNSWITCGAHKAGAYGVAQKAMQYILTLQDPDTGGFFRVLPGTKPPVEQTGDDIYQGGVAPGGMDVLNASMSGLACLAMGRIDAARRAGGFLHRVFAAQPQPESQFYFQWRAGDGLITNFPEDEQIPFVVDARNENQNYFQIGIAAAFLSRLHLVEPDKGHLDLARGYLNILDGYADDRYAIGKAGKVGWGASYVYRLTGDPKYLDITLQVGSALIGRQGGSGTWVETAAPYFQVEVTSEFVTLLSEMQEAFAKD
jgi:hypothetical protein